MAKGGQTRTFEKIQPGVRGIFERRGGEGAFDPSRPSSLRPYPRGSHMKLTPYLLSFV